MKKSKANYIIVAEETLEELSFACFTWIKEGYKPAGGVLKDGKFYIQAMWHEEEINDHVEKYNY